MKFYVRTNFSHELNFLYDNALKWAQGDSNRNAVAQCSANYHNLCDEIRNLLKIKELALKLIKNKENIEFVPAHNQSWNDLEELNETWDNLVVLVHLPSNLK